MEPPGRNSQRWHDGRHDSPKEEIDEIRAATVLVTTGPEAEPRVPDMAVTGGENIETIGEAP
jgi:hypothetical protein